MFELKFEAASLASNFLWRSQRHFPKRMGKFLLTILFFLLITLSKGRKFYFEEKIFHSRDGSVDPTPDAPRLPTPGIGLIENGALPLKPSMIGAKVFDLVRRDAKDGLRYDYDGVVTLATTSGAKTVKSTFASSFVELMRKESRSMSAKVGVEMGSYGGSVGVGAETKETDKTTRQSNVTWQSESLSQIDNSFIILSGDLRPTLAPEFLDFYNKTCAPAIANNTAEVFQYRPLGPTDSSEWSGSQEEGPPVGVSCLVGLMATRSHYNKEAALGSGLVKVNCLDLFFYLILWQQN